MPQSTIYRAERDDARAPAPIPAVAANALARLFGGIPALVDVSFELAAGRMLALVGPNGAGKTTLIRLLATAIRPSFGTLRLFGVDAATDAAALRSRVGYLGHANALYDGLTLRENLAFAGALRGLRGRDARQRVDAAIDAVGLPPFASDRVAGFSAGMRKRAALARLLLGRPSLVLLDEPYAALDVDGAALVDRLLGELRAAGATVVVASHAEAHLDAVADARLRL
ncbi:MAG: heme ABC exporter ATP-binding protein CcmA, partial [Chloroflexota bacterium]|nr:heme ABC exporter ATP-binding protein CcmA [Chloroflexota bacterium]